MFIVTLCSVQQPYEVYAIVVPILQMWNWAQRGLLFAEGHTVSEW